jgi:flagellar hook protein FlgE
VAPESLLVELENKGQYYLPHYYIKNWQHDDVSYPDQPIYTFEVHSNFKYNGEWMTDLCVDTLIEGSEMLLTYRYHRTEYDYFTAHDDLLVGDAYELMINDSQGNLITAPPGEIIEEIDGNRITFIEGAIDNYLDIGENFTVSYNYKRRGGLLESKHIFCEVRPWRLEMFNYKNDYYPFSSGSITSPLMYNLSNRYQYQLAVNYRLKEKSLLSYNFTITKEYNTQTFTIETWDIADDIDDEKVIVAYYYHDSDDDGEQEQEFINIDHIEFSESSGEITFSDLGTYDEIQNSIVYVDILTALQNPHKFYHKGTVNLATQEFTFANWEASDDGKIIPNYESGTNYPFDMDSFDSIWGIYGNYHVNTKPGTITQLYALLDDTDTLTYHVSGALNDEANGWNYYEKMVIKIGITNPSILKTLNAEFLYSYSDSWHTIGTSEINPEMIDEDGVIYMELPNTDSRIVQRIRLSRQLLR